MSEKKVKTIIDAPTGKFFKVEPERLTLITDPAHDLYDPRVALPVDENLVKNIMTHGVKVPITVRKNGSDHEVVAGRQRVKAALEANRRLTAEGKEPVVIKVIYEQGDETDMFGIMVLENELRKNDGPLEKAEKAKRFLDMGKTEEYVAITFGCSRQTLRTYLALLGLHSSIKKAVEVGELSATAAAKLAPLHHDEQKKMLEAMREQGGRMTASRTEKASRGENAAPVKRMLSRAKVADGLAAWSSRDDEYGKGFATALRWVMGEGEIGLCEA